MHIKFFAKPLKVAVFLLTAVLSFGMAVPLQYAQAALKTVGPINPANGYPQWYEDANGVMLSQCLDQNGFCLTEEPDTTQPISFPDNFSEEFFWFVAEAGFDVPEGGVLSGGGRGLIVMAIEGAFGRDEEIIEGNQIAFNRLRFRMDAPVSGTYIITHPYGVAKVEITEERLETTQGIRAINFDTTAVDSNVPVGDIGCDLLNPNDVCDFNVAATGAIGPFLIREGGIIVDQATGNRYIGNPNQETRVTGSPFGTNFLRIDGPEGSGIGGTDSTGNPIDFIQIDTFALMGKVTGNKPPVITEGTVTPPFPKIGIGNTVLSVRITDDVGGVQSATIDLTPIGGVAAAPLTLVPPGTSLNGAWTFTIDSFDAVGNFDLPIKAVDEAGNEGTGTISLTVTEATPPGEIKDLQAIANSSTQVALSWIATGDDNNEGTAASYDIRFSTAEIKNDIDFENAAPLLTNVPAPSAAGSAEAMTATGLNPNTIYFFAIKVSDEAENVSRLSNIASAATLNAPALAEIIVDPALKTLAIGQTQQFTASSTDQFGDPFDTQITWESSDPTVGIIDPATGMFTAENAGTTTVKASSGSVSGLAQVTVDATTNTPTAITLNAPGEWVLFSAPAKLASIQITEADIDAILTFDSATQQFTQVLSPSSPELLDPLKAFYIKTNKLTAITFTQEEQADPGLISRELTDGWNLISTTMSGLAKDEFSSIQVTLEHSGIVTLFVPQMYNARKDVFANWDTDANKDINANPIVDLPAKIVSPFDGYWVNMNGPDTYSKLTF